MRQFPPDDGRVPLPPSDPRGPGRRPAFGPPPLPTSKRGGSAPPAPPPLTAESRRQCPRCGREQGTTAHPIPPQLRAAAGGATIRWYWSDCLCEEERRHQLTAATAAAEAALRDRLMAAAMDYDGLRRVQHLQLRGFVPARLRPVGGVHPYDVAVRWLAFIADLDRGDERSGPPLALWFHCPNPGRGKTHLAAGLAHDHKAATGRPVCFLDTRTYLDRLWAARWEERPAIREFPASRAHLTVIDDLGRVGSGQGAAEEWDKLIDGRYLARRWTIITSQFTPDELLAEGRITDSTHSRLLSMTRGHLLYFDGDDQRRRSLEDPDA